MISIDTAKSIVNCYSYTTNADEEIFKSRSDVRQFAKWLELVLNVSIANDVLLNNRNMDEFLQKLASSIALEDVNVFAKLCFIYERMASIHVDKLMDQIQSDLEFETNELMNDFLDHIVNVIIDSIQQAKDEQWAEIRKQLKCINNNPDRYGNLSKDNPTKNGMVGLHCPSHSDKGRSRHLYPCRTERSYCQWETRIDTTSH